MLNNIRDETLLTELLELIGLIWGQKIISVAVTIEAYHYFEQFTRLYSAIYQRLIGYVEPILGEYHAVSVPIYQPPFSYFILKDIIDKR